MATVAELGSLAMELIPLPEDQFPAELTNVANKENYNYLVSLAMGQSSAGSGTLIQIGDQRGLLTAAHVADFIESSPQDDLTLVYRDIPHRLTISKSLISVPHREKGRNDEEGPDIAVVLLNDPSVVAQLESVKSFLPIERQATPLFEAINPPECRVCFIAGAPAELGFHVSSDHFGEGLTAHSHFFARAQLVSTVLLRGFDYLEFAVIAGRDGFPSSYGGVSGGAVWHIPLVRYENQGQEIQYERPEFVGVAFYQTFSEERCTVRAHGYSGIKSWIERGRS